MKPRTLLVIIIFFVIMMFNQTKKEAEFMPPWHFDHGCHRGICYSGDYNIGELSFNSDSPTFHKEIEHCLVSNRIVDLGNTPSDCWTVDFSFEGMSYTLGQGETVPINQYIEVTWNPKDTILINGESCHTIGEGEDRERICKNLYYEYDWNEPDWENDFTFTIYNPSFLIIDISDKHLADTVAEESFVTYDILNDLTNIDGGAFVREKHKLWMPSDTEKLEKFKVLLGTNVYKTSITTETLGDKTVSIKPFITVNNIVMGIETPINLFTDSDEKELRIIPNIEHIPEQELDFWRRNPPIETVLEETEEPGFDNTFLIIGGLAVAGIGYYFYKKKK